MSVSSRGWITPHGVKLACMRTRLAHGRTLPESLAANVHRLASARENIFSGAKISTIEACDAARSSRGSDLLDLAISEANDPTGGAGNLLAVSDDHQCQAPALAEFFKEAD